MIKYILKRLLLSIFIMVGVSMIIYFILRMMPMDFIDKKYMGSNPNPDLEMLARMKKELGLDDSSFGGILKGYFMWLGNFLKGDLGTTFTTDEPVSEVIVNNMGISFGISFVSLILELVIAIPLGIKCAVNQYGKLDYTATVVCMTLMAFPTFFLGSLFILLFADTLGWFDPSLGLLSTTLPVGVSGWTKFMDMIWHLVLPMIVLVLLNVGSYMRYQRTNTLEVLNADYIRTARAKGLSEGKVVYKHVFRNTMIPLVTVMASSLPMLFGGAMITETVFQIPGIGKITYDALMNGDIPLAMGYNMFIAILTVLGILLSDIMYAVVDPRVKLGK
ncbi:MAG: ABC transporter permease [Clostridiales bacterium]|nr:ABC transporter permease [Clostridiales bacterium]